MSAPPAWLRASRAAPAAPSSSPTPPLQQQQQSSASPLLVAHEATTTARVQPRTAATTADYRGNDASTAAAASPTSAWSGTLSRSDAPPPPQPSSTNAPTRPYPVAGSSSGSSQRATAQSYARRDDGHGGGGGSRGRSAAAAAAATMTMSGHARRVLRATPAPLLVSSEEAVATRTTGGRWAAQPPPWSSPSQQAWRGRPGTSAATRRRGSSHGSRRGSVSSADDGAGRSRAITPPPPAASQQPQQPPYTRRMSSGHSVVHATPSYAMSSHIRTMPSSTAPHAPPSPPPPLPRPSSTSAYASREAHTSAATAHSATQHTPLTRQNLRAWAQGQLHVAAEPASATASPLPMLFATERARSSSPSQATTTTTTTQRQRQRDAQRPPPLLAAAHRTASMRDGDNDDAASLRSSGSRSSRNSSRSSRRRGRGYATATAASTVAPHDGRAMWPPRQQQQQQQQQSSSPMPWWAQPELLHRGLARPASVSQAHTIATAPLSRAGNAYYSAAAAPTTASQARPPPQSPPSSPPLLVSNESVFVGKHRTVTRSNPLNIWSHESHVLRNWLAHNNNNNATAATTPPPMLFASAQSDAPAGGGVAMADSPSPSPPPRLVASEATTAVHTTRTNTATVAAAAGGGAALLTSSGSGGGGGGSSDSATTTTLRGVDDKPPLREDDGGGGGGGGDDNDAQPYFSSSPLPPPSAMHVRGRTFRSRNLNALHAFAWDRRIYLPAQDGLFVQPFRLFASPRFWEKLDWAVRGSLLCIVPMLILCLEPRTGRIFPLRASAVFLAFWINMPTLGGGLRELYIVLKGFSWSLVLLCIIIAWHPRQTWLVLLLLFLCVFLTAFAVEETRRISTYTLVLMIMQYIYDNESTTYRYVVDYFVTLLLALAFGMVSFAVPYIRWASDIAHHYLGVLGDAVSLSVRGMCAGFWVSSPLERQLHVTRLRQLRATITPCLSRIATGLSEMGYEPHTGVYTAQMRTRLAFLRHVSLVLESMTQVVEQIADDPALVDTPLCNAFGERMAGEVLRIGAVMDATILRITDLTNLVTAQDMDDFARAVTRYQDALADAREAIILNNADYHADHSDILLGFFFFCIEELCESIAAFHEAEVPPNNLVYFVTFPLRDINSLVVACITLRNAVWRRRTITRRLKEAIKLALCIVIAAIFQVYALGSNASPVAGVDIIALVYNRTGGMSFQYASNRLLGTVLGSLTGFLSVQIASSRRWVLYIFVALISFVGAYVQAAPGYYALGNAICNSVISIVTQYRDQTAAMVRIQQNCFAILIYFIVSSLVWPMRGNTKVKMGLDVSLRMFRETTYRMLRNLDLPEDATEVDRDASELLAEMNKRIVVQVTNLPGALVEPTMDSAEFPEMSWRMLIASQQKLLATLMMMRSAYRTFMSSKIGSGADRTNLSVHWVVLHRIAPYATELSHLLYAAAEIYLWSLSKATIVPTAHLTTIHEGMLHCRRRIFRVYLETIQREVDGSVTDDVYNNSNSGGGGDAGGDAGGDGVATMHNWWDKARTADAAAASRSSPHASPATSNNNNDTTKQQQQQQPHDATARRSSTTPDVSPSSSLSPRPPPDSPATGILVADKHASKRPSALQQQQQSQPLSSVPAGGAAAGNASFVVAGGGGGVSNASILRPQRKSRHGAFLGYRLRPDEQLALRSYIETGALLGNVAGLDQTTLNNASIVLDTPDFAAAATAAATRRRSSNDSVAEHDAAAATAPPAAAVTSHGSDGRPPHGAATVSVDAHEPVAALSSPTFTASFARPAPRATADNHSLVSPLHRPAATAAATAAATISNASLLPPHPPHKTGSNTFASAPLPGVTPTTSPATTATTATTAETRQLHNNLTFVGSPAAAAVAAAGGGGVGNASMRGARVSNHSMLLAGVHAARHSDPVMGGGDLFTAARPDRAKQLAANAAAAAAATSTSANSGGGGSGGAAAPAAESTSAVAAAGAAADTALAMATDAAHAASGHAQPVDNNNNVVASPAAALAGHADAGTPARTASGGGNQHNNATSNHVVTNATFAAPAAAAAVTSGGGGLLNSSLALHNRVAQGNVDVAAHDITRLPPPPSPVALANRTFVSDPRTAAATTTATAATTHASPVVTATEHQSTTSPPQPQPLPELRAVERATAADDAAAAAAAAAAAHEPSVFAAPAAAPATSPSRAPSRTPSRRPSALQRSMARRSGSFVPATAAAGLASNRSLAGHTAHATANNSLSSGGGGGGGGALSGLLSSIKRMGNKPGTSRFALRDYEEDAEVDRDTYAIDHMSGGGGEHAGLRGSMAAQRGLTQASPQLAADAGHTSPAGASGGGGGNVRSAGVSNASGLRQSFASALATLRRRGKPPQPPPSPSGHRDDGAAVGRAPPYTRDAIDDADDGASPEEREATAAAAAMGDGGGNHNTRTAKDVDEMLDDASNYDAAQGVFILTNRDVHSLEAFLFCIRTLITQVEEFEQHMLQMIHSNEMAKKL